MLPEQDRFLQTDSDESGESLCHLQISIARYCFEVLSLQVCLSRKVLYVQPSKRPPFQTDLVGGDERSGLGGCR